MSSLLSCEFSFRFPDRQLIGMPSGLMISGSVGREACGAIGERETAGL